MAEDLRLNVIVNDRQLRQLEKHLGGVGKLAGTAFKGVGIAAAGATAFMVSAVKATGEWETELNVLQATTNATNKQMKQMSALTKRLGADITLPATSAKDAAEAMTSLAKGGLSVQQTMKAAKGVLQLATAAQIDNAQAATITARALKAFNLDGGQAVKIANLLAAAANASTAEISDIALGFQQASAQAAGLRIPVQDLTTAIAQMADKGIEGAMAGVGMRTALQRMAPYTTKAKDAMRDLGIITKEGNNRLFDAQGRFVGISKAADIFQKATSGLTDEQKLLATQMIFGQDAQKAARIVFLQGADAFEKYRKRIVNTNAAQKLAEARTKGFQGQLKALRSAFETLQISVGGMILPTLTKLTKRFAGAVARVNDFVDALSKVKGFKGKFKFVMTGLSDLRKQLDTALFGGRQQVDVGRGDQYIETKGLVDKIGAALATVDWGPVGDAIVNGIVTTLQRTTQLAIQLAKVMMDAIDQIQWDRAGRKLGPAFAAMILSAISALMDPAFWLRNWDLMLSVALAAFPIGKVASIAGKLGLALTRPLLRLLPKGMREAVELMGRAITSAPVKAGAKAIFDFLDGAFTRLLKVSFGRLANVARFTIKVLGYNAAIKAVVGFVTSTINAFKRAIDWVKNNWTKALVLLLSGPFAPALILIYRFRDNIVNAFNFIKNKVGAAIKFVWDLLKKLGPILSAITDPLAIFRKGWELLGEAFELAKKPLDWIVGKLEWLVDNVGKIGGIFGKIGGGLKSGAKSATGWIPGTPWSGTGGIPPPGVPTMPTGLKPIVGGALARAQQMGLSLMSGFRPGAITSTGRRSLHSVGQAIDVAGTAGQMAAYARSMAGTPGVSELLYTPIGGWYPSTGWVKLSGQVAKDHYSHVHVGYGRVGDGIVGVGGRVAGPGWGAGTGGDLSQIIRSIAQQFRIDPRAVLAVAMTEGGLRRGGRPGDRGTSFGPFQLHRGGALPAGLSDAQAQQFADSVKGITYAIRKMAEAGARGKSGFAAIDSIVRLFERPADPTGEVRKALAYYKDLPKTVGDAARTVSATTARTKMPTLPLQPLQAVQAMTRAPGVIKAQDLLAKIPDTLPQLAKVSAELSKLKTNLEQAFISGNERRIKAATKALDDFNKRAPGLAQLGRDAKALGGTIQNAIKAAGRLPRDTVMQVRNQWGEIVKTFTPAQIVAKLKQLRAEIDKGVLTPAGLARAKAQVEQLTGLLTDGFSQAANKVAELRGSIIDRALRTFDAQTERILGQIDRNLDAQLKQIDQTLQSNLDAIDATLASQGAEIDRQLEQHLASVERWRAQLTPAERLIRQLTEAREKREAARALTGAQTGVSEAQARLNLLRARGASPEAIRQAAQALADAQEQLDQVVEDQRLASLQKQAEKEREARDQEAAERQKAYEEQAAQQRAALEAQAAAQRAALEAQAEADRQAATAAAERAKLEEQAKRDAQRIAFEAELNALLDKFENTKMTTAQKNRELVNLLNKYGIDYGKSGDLLGKAFGLSFANEVATYFAWVIQEAKRTYAAARAIAQGGDASGPGRPPSGAAGGGSCFPGSTRVRLVGGDKPIDKVKVGDDIVVWDVQRRATVPSTVTHVFKHTDAKRLLTIDTDRGTVRTTPEHRFYTGEAWISAGLLLVGDRLHTILGSATVEGLTEQPCIETVYNLEVAHAEHNYFAGGFLVHNMKQLQHGGIVTRPTRALIGEAGPEAVIPLDRMGGMGTTIIVELNVDGAIGDPDEIGRRLAAPIRDQLLKIGRRNSGLWT